MTDSPAAHGTDAADDTELVPAMCCEACGVSIASVDEFLAERAHTMDSATFGYELDVLDKAVWAYSATNPGATRFDVVRVKPVPGVFLTGEPTAEHSWFPPYEWRMAACYCGMHLGWSFSEAGGAPADGSIDGSESSRIRHASFHGLSASCRPLLPAHTQPSARARDDHIAMTCSVCRMLACTLARMQATQTPNP